MSTTPEALPRGPLAVLGLGLCAVSLAGPFIILSGVGPFALPAWRLLAVTALLLPPGLKALAADLRGLSRAERARLVLAGMLYGAHFAAFTAAFSRTTKESAVVLLGAQPLIAALAGAALLGEAVTLPMIVSAVVGLAGLVVFVGEHLELQRAHLVGDALVLLCSALLVGSYVIARRLRPRMSLVGWLLSLYGSGGLLCLVVALATGDPLWGYSTASWGWLAAAVLVSTLVGHSCYQYAVKYLPVFTVNLASLGEPVIAIAAMAALRERFPVFQTSELSGRQAVGGALLLVGVGLGLAWRARK